MSNSLSLEEAVKKAQDAVERKGALRLSGSCGAGKTSLCKTILKNYKEEVIKGAALMVAPRSREAVDGLSAEVLSELLSCQTGVFATDPRPVKTPAALAFAILKKYDENIRLLDVSDQTKLISEIMRGHVEHVSRGDECPVCEKLGEYIHSDRQDGSTTASKFEKIFLSSGFITKLREVFARFCELGIGPENKDISEFVSGLTGIEEDRKSYADLSWKIVQSLRREYAERAEREYPNRYDNSYMLLECRKKVEVEKTDQDLPKFIVVDDCQDLNLATFDLLEVLHAKGVSLVFVGNDDESVQKYKGAFPDVLSILETKGFEGPYSLESGYGKAAETEFLQNTAKNIGSWFQDEKPLRESGRAGRQIPSDPYFKCIIAKSEEEEIATLKNEILSYMMSDDTKSWGNLAVIANDNAFLQKIGEDLKRGGIPFKYTAVNDAPIKGSSIIRGMTALMQLAYYASGKESVENMRRDAFSLAVCALQSPLFEKVAITQIFSIKNFLQAVLSSLAVNKNQENRQSEDILQRFSVFKKWAVWKKVAEKDKDLEAFFAFLLINPDDRKNILDALKKLPVGGNYQNLEKLFDLLDKAKDIADVPELFCKLWENLKLGREWQSRALKGDAEANEWLDQLIRLQDLADTGKEGESIPDFLRRISDSYIESDSLAQVAPKDDRITLSSPSGVQSKRYEKVWVVGVQEKVWNKSDMEDLFSTRLLEAIATKNRVEKTASEFIPADFESFRDRFEAEEKYSNWRNFLVASSRANGETVFLAVSDQENAPYYALNSPIGEGGNGSENNAESELDCLTVAGMVEYCRIKLAKAISEGDGDAADDAAGALKILESGAKKADPESWNFMRSAEREDGGGKNASKKSRIYLNPSSVDGIWNTPVKQILQNNEGPIKSESQMQFGTIIHKCVEWATEKGKDRSESEEELKKDLQAHFEELQDEQASLSALDRGNCERKARKAIANLAAYFANACNPGQPENCPSDVPPLEESKAEGALKAEVTLEKVYEMAKRASVFKGTDITEDDFIEAMEILGEFDGLKSIKGAKITLTGRIDRLERRGGKTYVIDYKTGSSHCDGIKAFSDLQLFCYQLLLHFNDPSDPSLFENGYKGKEAAEKIKEKFGDRAERSMLFSVEKEPYPASTRSKDDAKKRNYKYGHYYQPCIFDASGTKFNESVNDRKKEPRQKTPITGHSIGPETMSLDALKNPVLKNLRIPRKGEDPDTWLPWIFYMFSKFFYAARYVSAARLQMREIDADRSDQDLIERAMTIYGMAEKINSDKE